MADLLSLLKLQFDRENYLENMLAVHRWALNYSFSHLAKPSVQTDWRKHSKVVKFWRKNGDFCNNLIFVMKLCQNYLNLKFSKS